MHGCFWKLVSYWLGTSESLAPGIRKQWTLKTSWYVNCLNIAQPLGIPSVSELNSVS